MGKGGVEPQYFLKRMELWEAQLYMDGLAMRERSQWGSTRWLGWLVSRCMGGKTESPEELMQFPWEKEVVDPEQEAADIAALLERCRQENRRVAGDNNTK